MSTQAEEIVYTCGSCGHTNRWTRDQIVQRGREEVYRGTHETRYSLPCQSRTGCSVRTVVALEKRGGD